LRNEYVNTTVLLRDFYEGEKLRFDASGNMIGTPVRESWTVAQIEITGIDVKHGGFGCIRQAPGDDRSS